VLVKECSRAKARSSAALTPSSARATWLCTPSRASRMCGDSRSMSVGIVVGARGVIDGVEDEGGDGSSYIDFRWKS
jgi:hypothetical protein